MAANSIKLNINADMTDLAKALEMAVELEGRLGSMKIPVRLTRIEHPEYVVSEKKKTINEVRWNLIIKTEKALEKELESNQTVMSPERVRALTGLMELLIK